MTWESARQSILFYKTGTGKFATNNSDTYQLQSSEFTNTSLAKGSLHWARRVEYVPYNMYYSLYLQATSYKL